MGDLDPAVLAAIEADTFWCLSKLLDGIQDNYISQQPGIQRLVKRMAELVKRIDCVSTFAAVFPCSRADVISAPLAAHFEEQGVEFMQFAFRWMNCLLMREISMKCTVRMWDTYLVRTSSCRYQQCCTDNVSGRRNRRVLAIPPIRLLRPLGQVFRAFTRHGFPGQLFFLLSITKPS